MPPIDFTNISYHAKANRENRFQMIENLTGWGQPCAVATGHIDKTTVETLTTTGVIIVRNKDNMIVTAYIARVGQAKRVWREAKNGESIPQSLWNRIHYNNNTKEWKVICGLA